MITPRLIFLTLLLGLSLIFHAHTIEPGFYSAIDNQDDFIFEEEQKADRVLRLPSPNEFDLGLGEVRDGGRSPLNFSWQQIRHFLKGEQHKDFMVIWFEKPIMWSGPVEETIQRLEPEFRKIGYKRILFLGGHCCGVHVLKDVTTLRGQGYFLVPRMRELGVYGD